MAWGMPRHGGSFGRVSAFKPARVTPPRVGGGFGGGTSIHTGPSVRVHTDPKQLHPISSQTGDALRMIKKFQLYKNIFGPGNVGGLNELGQPTPVKQGVGSGLPKGKVAKAATTLAGSRRMGLL